MNRFYLNNKSLLNGSFPVHRDNCPFLPGSDKRIYLGTFDSPEDAVATARVICIKTDACLFCLRECRHDIKMELHDWRVPEKLRIVISEN